MSFNKDTQAIYKMSTELEKSLIKEYTAALDSIGAELGKFYSKYAQNDVLTYDEAIKYNRLLAFEISIIDELKALGETNDKLIKSTLFNIYDESYFRTGFFFESGVQAKLAFNTLNPKVVELAIQNPISGLTLNERLSKNRTEIIYKIKQELTQGLIRGDSYTTMTRTLKEVLENDATKAKRIVQTESNRIMNNARNDAINHAVSQGVILKKVWQATLDDKTRDRHGELDGKAADKDGLFHMSGYSAAFPGDFGVASLDINCRCSVISVIEGFEPSVRRVRGEGVVPYKTYEEWRKAKEE